MEKTEELYKHTLFLYRGDYEKMQSLYPDQGAAVIIRQLVRDHVERYYIPPDLSKITLQHKL